MANEWHRASGRPSDVDFFPSATTRRASPPPPYARCCSGRRALRRRRAATRTKLHLNCIGSLEMMNESFLDRMASQLRSTCKYYTGYPKDLGPSRIIPFTSERQFVQLLHEGALIHSILTKYWKRLLLHFIRMSSLSELSARSIQGFASPGKGMNIHLLKYFTTQNRLQAKERAWILTSQSTLSKCYLSTMTRACMDFENISGSMVSSILKQTRFLP